METYLRISTEDRKRLINIAKAKQLSVSTACAIIIKNYNYIISNWFSKEYIKKGENLLHIKIRNPAHIKINTLTATNSIYAYLHNKEIKLPEGTSFETLNRRIQSEMDSTIDPNANKNMEMRIAYRLKKGNI